MVKGRIDELMKQSVASKAVLDRIDSKTAGSQRLFERAQKSFPSGSTRAPFYGPPYPLYISHAEGCYVWDVDGNKYLDFVNNYGPLVLGHRHPDVEKAVNVQIHSFWCGGPTESEILLAEELLKAFPMVDRVAFSPSGTEAVLRLVRAIRASTGKKKLAMSTGAFHGTSESVSSGAGILPEVESMVARFRYNDIESVRSALRNTKGELAAVFLEAVLGAAGSVPPTREFVKAIREETDKAGLLLVFDEIVTGFRLARGGISELYKVRPDCVSLGKIIGGGFPVGALLGPEKVMKEFSFPKAPPPPLVGRPRLYGGGTFNAHPVTMAAGLATLSMMTPDVYESLNNFGDRVRAMLSKSAEEAKIPHSVTGIGSMFRLHFTSMSQQIVDFETAQSSDERKGRIFDLLLRSKFVNMARFHTSFCSTPMGNEEFGLFKDAVVSSLSELESSVDL
jgi:glutamate-1-semialdehyde 2,1-aminomutase